jgi:hypothetical protein
VIQWTEVFPDYCHRKIGARMITLAYVIWADVDVPAAAPPLEPAPAPAHRIRHRQCCCLFCFGGGKNQNRVLCFSETIQCKEGW